MKFTILLLTVAVLQVNASSYGQTVTLKKRNATLISIFEEIRQQTGYDFIYIDRTVEKAGLIDLDLKQVPLKEALIQVFFNQPFTFQIDKNAIIVKSRPELVSPNQQRIVSGKVVDEKGSPLEGVNVQAKISRTNSRTVKNGAFSIQIKDDNDQLTFSFVGYDTQTMNVPAKGTNLLNIVLKAKVGDLDNIVITGIGIERKKESFTGATANFSGTELKVIGNNNIIASLRALDPSFMQIENNQVGSNPNALPNIEVRGQTSIPASNLRSEFTADPNLPLFILDGFETNLRTIVDLDMNIVASVTILKDASSTALYGSRASNGVVVVETIKPKSGKVKLSYSGDFRVETPDLRSYNMMNATEKLEFERLSGRYTATNVRSQLGLDSLYNSRLANVVRGVNTYWLDKPLQTGFSNRHSVSVRGGEGTILFDLGVNIKNTKGTMIGSDRDDWGGNLNLNYRTGKINVSNRASFVGSKSNETPYGSFSTWVNMNPYYEYAPVHERFIDSVQRAGAFPLIMNPLYNASIGSFNRANNFTINNNLQIIYDVMPSLRITAGGQVSKGNLLADNFVSPRHSQFVATEAARKGSLNRRTSSSFSYTANLMATYAKVFAEKHTINMNFRTEISENQSRAEGYKVVGFQPSSNGNPAFAFGYEENSKPSASTQIVRRNSVLASVNYSYLQKYNADFNFNMDGSTVFGSNNLYSPYYSGGLSWNVHREAFMKKLEWISMLRLRANMGVTGNQNFGSLSESIYNYHPDNNSFGQGVYLGSLGAPDLEWQRTIQTSVGMDLSTFGNRGSLQFNAYRKKTENLIVEASFPSSTGVGSYPFNAGELNVEGLETMINYSPIYRPKDQVVLTFAVMGAVSRMVYSNFNNKLKNLNQNLQNSKSLIRYKDGFGPRDIWAVPSLGIDPATGRELFWSKEGQQTFIYNSDDIIRIGSGQPLVEGTMRGSFNYKGFNANAVLRYVLQKDQMNYALYTKVENISSLNVESNKDRRALYDRWQNIGDVRQFKAISAVINSPISSRFIQTENTISLESLSLGYEFSRKAWLDKAKMSSLRITAFTNDIFYSSTVRRERGIDYPYSRSVSMSISVTFK
ncbi:SusC/RagA family TonB-linked outer membrane protein [Pedobacter nyackensis]|nr:SusC/RagA family TonB-linked outer membrane protein [Pedobacter nyackensis]